MQNIATSLSCICELYYIFTQKARLSWGRVGLYQSAGVNARLAHPPASTIGQTSKAQALAHTVKLGAGQLFMLVQVDSGCLDTALPLPIGQGCRSLCDQAQMGATTSTGTQVLTCWKTVKALAGGIARGCDERVPVGDLTQWTKNHGEMTLACRTAMHEFRVICADMPFQGAVANASSCGKNFRACQPAAKRGTEGRIHMPIETAGARTQTYKRERRSDHPFSVRRPPGFP